MKKLGHFKSVFVFEDKTRVIAAYCPPRNCVDPLIKCKL